MTIKPTIHGFVDFAKNQTKSVVEADRNRSGFLSGRTELQHLRQAEPTIADNVNNFARNTNAPQGRVDVERFGSAFSSYVENSARVAGVGLDDAAPLDPQQAEQFRQMLRSDLRDNFDLYLSTVEGEPQPGPVEPVEPPVTTEVTLPAGLSLAEVEKAGRKALADHISRELCGPRTQFVRPDLKDEFLAQAAKWTPTEEPFTTDPIRYESQLFAGGGDWNFTVTFDRSGKVSALMTDTWG
jgi:hypothetical protein